MIGLIAASLVAFTSAYPHAAPTARPHAARAPRIHRVMAYTDTIVLVRPGTHLELGNIGGDIDVTAWGRNAVRVAARHAGRYRIVIDGEDSTLNVRTVPRRSPAAMVSYEIQVPVWMALDLWGLDSEISIEGVQAAVKALTKRGRVRLRGGRGAITLASVEGSVSVEDAQGQLELSSVNDGVRAANCKGVISAESVNGPIVLEALESSRIEATTVNGEVYFDGALEEGSHYNFASHNGDIVVSIPENTNATISVATFSGAFESSFPLTLTEARRGKRLNFTLGSGRARLDLGSFQGSIQLRRRGAARPKE